MYIFRLLFISLVSLLIEIHSYRLHATRNVFRLPCINMGFGDMLKKALANDPNLTPASNPGLSKTPEKVIIEFVKTTHNLKLCFLSYCWLIYKRNHG